MAFSFFRFGRECHPVTHVAQHRRRGCAFEQAPARRILQALVDQLVEMNGVLDGFILRLYCRCAVVIRLGGVVYVDDLPVLF